MKKVKVIWTIFLAVSIVVIFDSCMKEELIIAPMTFEFETKLSAYEIFEGEMSELNPTNSYQIFELSSSLYSDYAYKQRLIKLPIGTQLTMIDDGLPVFPDGTILVKTFYYYLDDRDPDLGMVIIETRLLVKAEDQWNVATYVWNEAQTEATLNMEGHDKQIEWVNGLGFPKSTNYHVPSEFECLSCHQFDEQVIPIGPKLRNLNRDILINNQSVNQLSYFQDNGLIDDFDHHLITNLPDYNDVNVSLDKRGRAYLDLNCGHCHHKSAWSKPANKRFDFRYEVSLEDSKICDRKSTIKEVIRSGRMPYFGKTLVHEEGADLIREYINNLD